MVSVKRRLRRRSAMVVNDRSKFVVVGYNFRPLHVGIHVFLGCFVNFWLSPSLSRFSHSTVIFDLG